MIKIYVVILIYNNTFILMSKLNYIKYRLYKLIVKSSCFRFKAYYKKVLIYNRKHTDNEHVKFEILNIGKIKLFGKHIRVEYTNIVKY